MGVPYLYPPTHSGRGGLKLSLKFPFVSHNSTSDFLSKGSCKNNVPCLGVDPSRLAALLVLSIRGACAVLASCQTGISAPKRDTLFLRDPYPHESRKTPFYTNIHIAGVMIECCDLDGVSVGIVTSFVPHFNSKVCLSVCPIFKPLCP